MRPGSRTPAGGGLGYLVELSFFPVTSIGFQIVTVTFRKFRLLPENLNEEQTVRTGPGLQF